MADIVDTIRRVRELDAAATKGPWKPSVGVYQDMDGDSEADDCFFGRGPVPFPHARALGEADAALIAEYRTAAPLLADECERLRERVRVLEEALRTVEATGAPGGSICAKRGDDHKCGWCRGMWTPCPVSAARAALAKGGEE